MRLDNGTFWNFSAAFFSLLLTYAGGGSRFEGRARDTLY